MVEEMRYTFSECCRFMGVSEIFVREAFDEKQAREDPQPLTVDNLRDRIGKPVYLNKVGIYIVIQSLTYIDNEITLISATDTCDYIFDATTFYDFPPEQL